MTSTTPEPRGLEAFLTTLSDPESRRIAIEAVAAELRGLREEAETRSIRAGGRIDLTLDDVAARLTQVTGLHDIERH